MPVIIQPAPGGGSVTISDSAGVPAGGADGQYLRKASAANYDTEWSDSTTTWGDIDGTLSTQPDLQAALDAKLDDSQLDTDTTLAANSDTKIATQKAVKAYVDANAGGGSGSITASGYTQSTGRLLGRATSGTGAIEEIALGANLSINGGVLEAGDGLNSYTLVNQSGNPITSTTVTITIASPGVVSWTGHGLAADTAIILNTTGALPTGLTVGTIYYVRNPAANSFELSATVGGASINTTGSQSGTHSAQLAASWVWSTNVAAANFTGLAGASEILVVAYGVAVSVSGAATVQVSTNNGSSYYSTSGDYLAIDAAGTAVNTIGATLWGTNSTAARYGQVLLHNPDTPGVPKMMNSFLPSTTPLRIFIADLWNDIDALRVVGSSGGNLTAGRLYVYVK